MRHYTDLMDDKDYKEVWDLPPHIPLSGYARNYFSNWLPSDTEANFKKFPKPGFTPESISYCLNEWGYRVKPNEHWDLNTTKKRIAVYGCSHTVGIGVAWENTWPVLIQNKFDNSALFNLGRGGGAGDTVIRLMYHSLPIIKPDIVFVFWPWMRVEDYGKVFPDGDTGEGVPSIRLWQDMSKEQLNNHNHIRGMDAKNQAFAKTLAQAHNFKLVSLESQPVLLEYVTKNRIRDYSYDARDSHPGIEAHKHVAKKFLEELELRYPC